MKKVLLLLVSVIMIQGLTAQDYSKGNSRRFSFGVSGGIPIISGDMKNKFVGYDLTARLNWHLTTAFSVGGEFGIGSVKGEDGPNEYFTNNYMKALLGGEVYLFNLLKVNKLSKWFQPYAGINFGAVKSDIEAAQSEFHYNDWTWAHQYNAGVKFKLTNMIDLNASANMMYTGSDLIDNFDPNSHRNKSRDAIGTFRLGLTFHIGKKKNSSIIWKNDDNMMVSNNGNDDSLKIHTQNKLLQFESQLAILAEQNTKLNDKIDSKNMKIANNEKEVNDLEVELNSVKNEVSVLEGSLRNVPNVGSSNAGTTVYFETANDAIPMSERSKLSNLADYLNTNSFSKVLVKGYTDKRGDAQYNMALSLKRANKVKSHLISLGVDSNRIETYGLGENHSLPTSLQGNRRVVVTVE